MRSYAEMQALILAKAQADERIRAVLLNGSRANDSLAPDPFQDYDLVFIVTEIASFTQDHGWTDYFGQKVLWQLPDTMAFGTIENKLSFTYLMVFSDGNRLDLSLYPQEHMATFRPESLTKVWLDKDGTFDHLLPSSDRDHRVLRPSQKLFADISNEFWWVAPYVAKALQRGEIIHAKEIMEGPLRAMFLRMLEIRIGTETDFRATVGKGGRFLRTYLSAPEYEEVLLTYPNYEREQILGAMDRMMTLFATNARRVGEHLYLEYNVEEEARAREYYQWLLAQEGPF
ncbi:MAG: aminoglycoside 6-adenylyltransferase [Bacteroidota bacterium]